MNKKFFSFVTIAIFTLMINPCFAMTDETTNLYNQIINTNKILDKNIEDLNRISLQVDILKQRAQDITKNYKNTNQVDFNKRINNLKELKIIEQKYIDSLSTQNAEKEFNDLISLAKELFPKLQQEDLITDKPTAVSKTLQKSAKYIEEIYALKLELVNQQKSLQLEERDLTVAQIDYLKRKVDLIKTEIAGCEAQSTQLDEDIRKNEEVLNTLIKQIKDVENDYRKLQKYKWVPFYNFYWACKNLDNKVKNKYKKAKREKQIYISQLEHLNSEQFNLKNKLLILNKEIQKFQDDFNNHNKYLVYYVEQINYLTQAKSKYSNMIVTIGKIINKLEYNSSSVEDMQKVVEDIISNQQ